MVQARTSGDLQGRDGALIYRELAEGVKVRMNNGAVAQVVSNAEDGAWLLVRYLDHPAKPAMVGEEELVFFTDVDNVI
jgi:hypothetical protein